MDRRDLEIIRVLEENARLPLTEIARRLGISETAVRKRIARLEREGVIEGYTVRVNPAKLGFTVVAFVGVDATPERYLEVASKLASLEEVKYLAITSGDHMIMAEVWARDGKHLMEVLSKKIGAVEGVKRVCPAVVIERLK